MTMLPTSFFLKELQLPMALVRIPFLCTRAQVHCLGDGPIPTGCALACAGSPAPLHCRGAWRGVRLVWRRVRAPRNTGSGRCFRLKALLHDDWTGKKQIWPASHKGPCLSSWLCRSFFQEGQPNHRAAVDEDSHFTCASESM